MEDDPTGKPPLKPPENTNKAAEPPEEQWQFKPEDSPADAARDFQNTVLPPPDMESVRWTASQFVAHHKTAQWYINLAIATAVFAGLIYLVTRGDIIATMAVVVAALFFGISASRQPRVLEYELSTSGITAGRQFFPYSTFKSFALVQEAAVPGIVFMPLKRFMPVLTVYFSPEDEHKILPLLSSFLPLQEAKQGPIEHFIQRIRF